ncbi:unnamed protein product [Paramecium sonneborni]|uniref:Uncharacterized protein n=1 Tax=Paramecium sonneborni TaxID=65129 RepID=A0A8S1PBH2_9CILI|nr:unnamed protein product [Paramecium sonneborni]
MLYSKLNSKCPTIKIHQMLHHALINPVNHLKKINLIIEILLLRTLLIDLKLQELIISILQKREEINKATTELFGQNLNTNKGDSLWIQSPIISSYKQINQYDQIKYSLEQ